MVRTRGIAFTAVVVVLLAGCANATTVADPSGGSGAGSGGRSVAPIAPSPPGSGSMPGAGPTTAPPRWAEFPVTAKPRPIVLVGPAIEGPASGFPDGDSKIAFMNGQVQVAVPLPSGPATWGGYPVIAPAAAAAQLTVSPGSGVSSATILHVVAVELAEHPFPTDRGRVSLPAWQLHLDAIQDDVFVLAVAKSDRYPQTLADGMPSAGDATSSGGGRELTVRFTPRHVSTGPCDPGYTSSISVEQDATAVVLAIAIRDDPPPRVASNIACPLDLRVPTGPIVPGAPNTRTIQLAAPLGARLVVDPGGQPFVVTTQ